MFHYAREASAQPSLEIWVWTPGFAVALACIFLLLA